MALRFCSSWQLYAKGTSGLYFETGLGMDQNVSMLTVGKLKFPFRGTFAGSHHSVSRKLPIVVDFDDSASHTVPSVSLQ
jgi:hypothetical protein